MHDFVAERDMAMAWLLGRQIDDDLGARPAHARTERIWPQRWATRALAGAA